MAKRSLVPRESGEAPGTALARQQHVLQQQLRERSRPLSALRAAARLEIDKCVSIMGQIARNDLRDDKGNPLAQVDPRTQISAFRALSMIGVPQTVEIKNWDGDWSLLRPEELLRVQQGEHPEDILARRRVDEIIIDEVEDFSIPPEDEED